MSLLKQLREEAESRGLLAEGGELDPATVFALVRDMPYQRASDRRPKTLLREWRGTCSGKHYLLKSLFAELSIKARVMACRHEFLVNPAGASPELRPVLEAAEGRVVDVHNYLVLELPEGEMVVDATWPDGSEKYGMVVNHKFVLGQDQKIAAHPLETWVVPEDQDPQEYKNTLLREHFTEQELATRDAAIHGLATWLLEQGK